MVGIPTLASPVEAFAYAITSGENGLLAANPQEWESALDRLVIDPALREALGARARAHVQEYYHPRRRTAELLETLNQACQQLAGEPFWAAPDFHAQDPPAHTWLNPDLERQPTLARLAFYTLRRRGLLTMLKQVWIYFRRLLAPVFPYRKRA